MSVEGRAVKKQWSVAVLLALLCLSAFLGVRDNGFINLDDKLYITENPMVARGLSAQGIAWAFTTTRTGNWHPATWISHMLDVQLFGMAAGAHHLTSLALHTGSVLLLYASLCAMTGAVWRSFFVAALFAVHPMRVESVAWASERKDVFAMFFTLLALWAYLRGLRRPSAGNRIATVGLFAIALLAKPMPVTFPFLLLLLDWWPLGRWMPRRSTATGIWATFLGALPPRDLWREKTPFFVLAAASGAATFVAQSGSGSVAPFSTIPFAVRGLNAVASYGDYIAGTLWPGSLAAFYPHPSSLPPWPSWAAGLLIIAVITILAWRLRDRYPCLPVGWFWFLGSLLPMIGLVQVGWQARADRYTYLPQIGIFILGVWGGASAIRKDRIRRAFAAAGVGVVLAFAATTASLVPSWRTSISLYTRALTLAAGHSPAGRQNSPAFAFIHNVLGQAYHNEGRLEEAISHYQSALDLDPSYSTAMNNLARVLEQQGRVTEANALYVQALTDPGLAEPRINLGNILLERGQPEDAARLFREAIAIDPIEATGHSNLGICLALTGRPAEAERAFRESMALNPDYEPAHFNLGKLLLEQGRFKEAIDQLKESLRLEPYQVAARVMLKEASERAVSSGKARR